LLARLPRRRARIGLLGGSFNPAHDGHLYISQAALRRLGLDRVWWLVSPGNPLKKKSGMASLQARLSHAHLIARDSSRIDVSDLEREIQTVYTIDTVGYLTRVLPHVKFVWLMGADNLTQIPEWRRWPLLFRVLPIAVFDRSTYAREALLSEAGRFFARSRLPSRMAGRLGYSKSPTWVFVRSRLHPESGTRLRHQGMWRC
jgi:nicotinate-nucleotide adenylyltransferase